MGEKKTHALAPLFQRPKKMVSGLKGLSSPRTSAGRGISLVGLDLYNPKVDSTFEFFCPLSAYAILERLSLTWYATWCHSVRICKERLDIRVRIQTISIFSDEVVYWYFVPGAWVNSIICRLAPAGSIACA